MHIAQSFVLGGRIYNEFLGGSGTISEGRDVVVVSANEGRESRNGIWRTRAAVWM